MPAQLASFLCLCYIIGLFALDRNNNDAFTKTLWVPFLWFIYGYSDKIFQWLHIDIFSGATSTGTIEEGNPVHRTVYLILIIAGIWILSRRNIEWRTFFTRNKWVWLYFLLGLISCLWSDFPFISFKRLIKATGVPIMALVLLTEARPYAAVGLILKRMAFILLPLSVLFIKYYPQLGRTYHMGEPMFAGVSDHKNGLGALCLITGIYFLWNLLYGRRIPDEPGQRHHVFIYLTVLPMIAWLLYTANSATSIACIFFAAFLFLVSRHPTFTTQPGKILAFGITGSVLLAILQPLMDFKGIVFEILGRNPTITNRTDIWDYLLGMAENRILGSGYESFWLGERLATIQERWGGIVQAHNGYIEMYLNMGLIGVAFIILWVLSGISDISKRLQTDYSASILRLCLLLVVLLYNYTEATFFGVISMWILFFVGILSVPERKHAPSSSGIFA